MQGYTNPFLAVEAFCLASLEIINKHGYCDSASHAQVTSVTHTPKNDMIVVSDVCNDEAA